MLNVKEDISPFYSSMANSIDVKLGRDALIKHLRDFHGLRGFLAMSYIAFKSELTPLEVLDQQTKIRLWKLSEGCKDRIKFCQALWYYENIC